MTSRSTFWLWCLVAACTDVEDDVAETAQSLVDADFFAQGLAGKCIAVDPKSFRVGIRTCASTADQRLRIVEHADRLVELRLHDRCVQPLHGVPVQGVVLEIAPCSGAPGQRWMLDGDSIRLGPQPGDPFPDLLVSVKNRSGSDGSPLSIEGRRFDDSDYWELGPADRGGPQFPTSGFVRVTDRFALAAALDAAAPGTVVDIAADVSIDLFECGRTGPGPYDHTAPRLRVGPRVTLRSGGKNQGRRPVHAGGGARLRYDPFLYCLDVANPTAIVVDGMGARVTGFRLEGLSIDGQDDAPRTYGIFVSNMDAPFSDTCDPLKAGTPRKVEIDHMELTGWKDGAVAVWGASSRIDDNGTAPHFDWDTNTWTGGDWTPLAACRCSASKDEGVSVLVARNYIHHNTRPDGYGVLVSDDGHATIVGNTFLHNRHAISAEGTSGVRFYASANLVHAHGEDHQDFDVHGSGPCGGGARGGVAGERIDVLDNTFLGTDRNNLYLRGQPCLGARYSRNVTRQQRADGWLELESTSQAVRVSRCPWEGPVNLDVTDDNVYEISDPTARLGIGDFNGDGRDDVFVATGAAFYVSFDGQAAWALRAVSRERLEDLFFADHHGDPPTQLQRNAPNGEGIQILFGGEGDWTPLRPDVRLPDLLAGDFDGDGRDDLISTDGTRWRFSRGGTAPWTTIRNETRRASEFRVGRIDLDATDDVFGVLPSCNGSQDCWAFFASGTSPVATFMGPALADIDHLAIADANNDGRGDVVRTTSTIGLWQISVSLGGADPWALWAFSEAKPGALGRFGGGWVALVWKSLGWRSVTLGQPSQGLAWFEMF